MSVGGSADADKLRCPKDDADLRAPLVLLTTTTEYGHCLPCDMSTQTSAAPFENRYFKRLVAEKDAKPCSMCYRSTATVLTTVANQDFFYICPSHLKDPTFAEVDSDESARIEAQRMEAEVAEESEKIVREFEERAKKETKKDADVKDKEDSTEDKNKVRTGMGQYLSM